VTDTASRSHLLFDGDCGICTWSAERFGRMDRERRYAIEPFQDLDDIELERLGVTREQCARAVQIITPTGRVHRGAMAINHLLWQRLPGKLLVIVLYAIPVLWLSELVAYRLVANQRHRLSRWFGLKACRVKP
jgi:predicted DCC family thiol-disulfide oxidoreductase YuxK